MTFFAKTVFWFLVCVHNCALSFAQYGEGIDLGFRIIKGEETHIEVHKYIVSVHQKAPFGEKYLLKGSAFIIADLWAISAAHVFYVNSNTSTLVPLNQNVLIGGMNGSSYDFGIKHRLVRRINHEKFDRKNLHLGNDIVLLKVSSPFTFQNEVKVPIAGKNFQYNIGDEISIMGWGLVDPKGTFLDWKDKLNEVNLVILSMDRCNLDGRTIGEVFCAGEKILKRTAQKDSCLGDSGGPVLQYGVATGIVSFGNGHGSNVCGAYGVYTKLGAFEDWIKDNIRRSDGDWAVRQIHFFQGSSVNPQSPQNVEIPINRMF